MRKRNIAGIAATTALAIAAVGAVANAETPPPSPSPSIQQDPKTPQTETQEPAYTGSIRVPQTADTHNDAAESANEATESAALAALATVSEADARNAALGRFPGATITSASLGDENGSLVWEINLTDTASAAHEVKVDAGNGAVLAVEAGGADSEQADTEND